MTNYKLKLQVALVALFVAAASSAALAASASAVEALTGAEWLFNGAAVTAALSAEFTETEMLLEDTKVSGVKAVVKCSLILDGSVTTSGGGEIKELLNSSKEAISLTPLSGLALSCTGVENCGEPKVWAVDLPWSVELAAGEVSGKELFMITIPKGTGGNPGWYVECTVFGVKISDECTDEVAESEAKNVTGGVEAIFSATQEEELRVPLATCSQSKEATGVMEGKGVVKDTEAGTLSVAAQGGQTVDASPNPLKFPTIKANETREAEVTFTNLGPGGWTPGAPKIDFGPATFLIVANSNTCNVVIAVDASCLILLEFAPRDAVSRYLGRFAFGALGMWLEGETN